MIYTLGADPEFFIEHDNKLHSIEGLLGGTKYNPKILDDHGDFKVQEDNVAAEYNIPPSNNKEHFINNILYPQQAIIAIVGAKKFTISTKASGSFPKEQLKTKQAQEFGCDPDYNAWTLEPNIKPQCKDKTFRSCGGHLHFGMKAENPMDIVQQIKKLDHVLGIWSVLTDTDEKRKQLYGKAGAFRLQPHGGEYRVLSNFWIFSKDLISEVWDRAQLALNLPELDDNIGDIVQQIINTGNKNGARMYLKANGLS